MPGVTIGDGWNWPVDVITEHVRTIWTGTPTELEQAAKEAGLLD
jgi:virginiamycin A acetyltransferase